MADDLQDLGSPMVQLPVMAVAEVQDSILVVMNDLHRLQGLLDHAAENLLDRFSSASRSLAGFGAAENAEIGQVQESLQCAVTELQFHDMATQLIGHTSRILQSCAYRLAAEAMGREEDEEGDIVEEMPERPNPVTQSEMDAGSIDLF